MDSTKRRRLFRIVGIGMGIVIFCPILVHFGRAWVIQMWGDLRFINYFVAFIPTILSILFAFVIDKELERRMKMMWRLGIVGCGVLYSFALWHQQSLTDQVNATAQKALVQDAISEANKHSDEQFASVRSNVGSLQGQVSDLGKSLEETAKNISSELEKSSTELGTSISKVGKPDPPVPARLRLSLWDSAATVETPVLTRIVQPDGEGNFPVEFLISNSSESTAESIDVWIRVCDSCSFVKEPVGFEKLPGADDHVRHRSIPALNPGVSFQKDTILVRSLATGGYFQIAFSYSCKTCGGKVSPNQIATVFQGPSPTLKPR